MHLVRHLTTSGLCCTCIMPTPGHDMQAEWPGGVHCFRSPETSATSGSKEAFAEDAGVPAQRVRDLPGSLVVIRSTLYCRVFHGRTEV